MLNYNLFYPIDIESKFPQDSSYMGNIAASNAVWVNTFGTKRRKGNTKKLSSNLRRIAPVDCNEGSNDGEDEDIEEESGIPYQYQPKRAPSPSTVKKSSATLSGYSSPEPSPSSSQNATSKRLLNPDDEAKKNKKKKDWEQDESGSDNSILEIKKPSATKKYTESDLIKEQLKMSQNRFDQMNKMCLVLTQQLTTKREVKPNPETSSLKKNSYTKKGCFKR